MSIPKRILDVSNTLHKMADQVLIGVLESRTGSAQVELSSDKGGGNYIVTVSSTFKPQEELKRPRVKKASRKK